MEQRLSRFNKALKILQDGEILSHVPRTSQRRKTLKNDKKKAKFICRVEATCPMRSRCMGQRVFALWHLSCIPRIASHAPHMLLYENTIFCCFFSYMFEVISHNFNPNTTINMRINRAPFTQKDSFRTWRFKRKASTWSIKDEFHTSFTFCSKIFFLSDMHFVITSN